MGFQDQISRVQILQPSLAYAAILIITAAFSGNAHAKEPWVEPMRSEFARFHDALYDRTTSTPAVERGRTWARASNAEWSLVADRSGNRTFRPVDASANLSRALQRPISAKHEKLRIDHSTRNRLIEQTRALAADLSSFTQSEVHVKREILLTCGPDGQELKRYAGRYLVRLSNRPDKRFFQAIYSPELQPIRIDTNARDGAGSRLADVLSGLSTGKTANRIKDDRGRLVLGTFFATGEYRFEIQAYSYEGEPFLKVASQLNPFERDRFDLSVPHLVDPQQYRISKDYRYWCWRWWDRYGQVGSVRGNFIDADSAWEFSDVEVLYHKSLADFPLEGGEPKVTREYKESDGKTYRYPFAEREALKPVFYNHLEDCHVAVMEAHGGFSGSGFRFKRNPDVWVAFSPPNKLGSGKLRHLFIEGCSGMGYVEEPDKPVLLKAWIESRIAGGIRTICGEDGEHTSLDRSGWRFFGYYNKGDSISDAWLMRDMDENPLNNPCTVAYGPTRTSAIDTLVNGRFDQRAAKPKWIAVSVWTNP